MKRNITVNLYGQLYAIDEDAYRLLDQYLENMKRYFAAREGGDEIADDIEHRVGELFAELQATGIKAINIGHVHEIIRRIGNPEELDSEEEAAAEPTADSPDTSQTAEEYVQTDTNGKGFTAWCRQLWEKTVNHFHGRYLYRDSEDIMVGGVMSGLCKYFGGNDPLPWRILMVLACVLSYASLALVYLLAWALIPQARTADERLQMCGKPVNPQTLNEELMRQSEAQQMPASNTQSSIRSSARGCLSTLLSIIGLGIKLLLIFIIGGCLLASATLFAALLAFACFGVHILGDQLMAITNLQILNACPNLPWIFTIAAGAALISISVLLYVLIRWLIVSHPAYSDSQTPQQIAKKRWALALVIVLSGAVSIALSVIGAAQIESFHKQQHEEVSNQGGYFLNPSDRKLMAEGGWEVIHYKNVNKNGALYHTIGSPFCQNEYFSYMTFKQADLTKPIRVAIERREPFEAGYYHIEGIGYAKSMGSFLYVRTPEGLTTASIPVNDVNNNGNLSQMNVNELSRISYFTEVADSANYAEWLHERTKPFSYIRSATFYHPGGDLTMGITNVPEYIGLPPTQGAARKFGLVRLNVIKDSLNTSTAHLKH